MTAQDIAELQAQLEQKKAEVKAIYDKLAKAGVVAELPEDLLDEVAGGFRPTGNTLKPAPSML